MRNGAFENLSIRIKILLSLSVVAVFSFLFSRINVLGIRQSADYTNTLTLLRSFEGAIQHRDEFQTKYSLIDCRNTEYFKTLSSENVAQYFFWTDSAVRILQHTVVALEESGKLNENREFKVNEIKKGVLASFHLFNELRELIRKRGYVQYGLEGELRDEAHRLEEILSNGTDLLLQMRRHEKDFMLRGEQQYIDKFNTRFSELLALRQGVEVKERLIAYHSLFNEFAKVHNAIGHTAAQGKLRDVLGVTERTEKLIRTMVLEFEEESGFVLSRIQLTMQIFQFALLLVIIGMIWFLGKQLSKPVFDLRNALDSFVEHNFELAAQFPFSNRKDEFGRLSLSLQKMADEITITFKQYRTRSEERQKVLKEQKDKLEIQKLLLQENRNLLQERHDDIRQSIDYARRLQNAIFPRKEKIDRWFGTKHFELYLPKDVVSGDFYYIDEVEGTKYVAVGDCTGHGVPGAFLSFLGFNFLNYAIKDKNLENPAAILTYLNAKITEVFNQNGFNSEIKDGMDIALLAIEEKKGEKRAFYCGANIPLYLIRQQSMVTIRPNRFPIGDVIDGQRKFTAHELDLRPGDRLYLSSDGYQDQIGGPANKKYKTVYFRDLLLQTSHLDYEEQQKTLLREFREWKGANTQIDDVCIVGIGI